MDKIIEIPEGYEARIEGNKVVIEPKESEDERIRKEIIEFINWAESRGSVRNDWHQKKCPENWIAYLEKQKEQKSAEWSEEDKKMLEDIIQDYECFNKQPMLTPTYRNKLDWLKSFPERLNLQPKEEWSEEDEAAFGDLMWCVEQARKSAKDENDMGNIWFAENWVKNRLKSLRPQHKQEWSEEDETIIDCAVEVVEKAGLPSLAASLKSLRFHSHWKPSEEQMEALYVAIGMSGQPVTLQSLYNELKKLM